MEAAVSEPDGRRRRGQQTRARIAAAAGGLFVETGFTSTTVGAIAAAAGVSEQSVYYGFGTKEAVAAAALDLAIAGDDLPVPTLERPWVAAALADPDPAGQLRRQVAGAADILRRAAPLLEAIRGAAAGNPALDELWRTNVAQRREVQDRFMRTLRTKARLRPTLSVAAATDISTLMLSPEAYFLLVRTLGWSHRRWTSWTSDALVREILPSQPSADSDSGAADLGTTGR